jgi:hypothetical protein
MELHWVAGIPNVVGMVTVPRTVVGSGQSMD